MNLSISQLGLIEIGNRLRNHDVHAYDPMPVAEVMMAAANRRIPAACRVFALLLVLVLGQAVLAGSVEDRPDGTTVIHIGVYELPDPAQTDLFTRAEVAAVRLFVRQFPTLFAKRYRAEYEAHPEIYGRHHWDRVEVELEPFNGIQVKGVEPDLLAIAGGVAPDVLYVNFKKSNHYIQNGFLYPLDQPRDHYFGALTPAEVRFHINPKLWPVIRRKGPDGNAHVWAMPSGGILGTVLLFRKDLFKAKHVPFPTNDWTWKDLLNACRKISDPAHGIYGIVGGSGTTESWFWFNYLWSAGGEVMTQNPTTGKWRCVYDTHAAAVAADFFNTLYTDRWVDKEGHVQRGYAIRSFWGTDLWKRGQVAMNTAYIDGKVFQTIDPDVTGMVPTPLGPTGIRGAELNCRMMGLSSQIRNPVVRDAAWDYLRFVGSKQAVAARTAVMVRGGMGRFVNPKYLKLFGYDDIARMAPKGWTHIFETAIATGHPEPYGPNASYIYQIASKPLLKIEQLSLEGQLPSDRQVRLGTIQSILHAAVAQANETLFNDIPPHERHTRDVTALAVLVGIVVLSFFILRKAAKDFSRPTDAPLSMGKSHLRRFGWAYILLLPALLTIGFWQYLPLARGSFMAFQDYRILGHSSWVGVQNFGDILFSSIWWMSVWNSLRYTFLVMGLTFIPPIILAILLQEAPAGSVFFRTIYYLPGVLTSLVTMLLWQQLYLPSSAGALNATIMHIPAILFIAIGLLLLGVSLTFSRRLWHHDKYLIAALFAAVGAVLLVTCSAFAMPILFPNGQSIGESLLHLPHTLFSTTTEPYRWLTNPNTAMLATVIPMVWAGIGPGCLIYLAALKGIANDFYEAADLDGATFLDKILFVVFPILKPLILINFIGVFIAAWYGAAANILALTGGSGNTEVADLHIFYTAFTRLRFGPATAMAWVIAAMLIGFTIYQLRIISRLEFKTTGRKE